jgi:fibronectin type 3 domain-containing protein
VAAFQTSAAPSGLTASASGTTVTLQWTADSSASAGYDVYQGSASGQESSSPVLQSVGGTTTTVSALQAGLTYYFKISAVTALGPTPLSNEAHATLAPSPPTNLAAGSGASNGAVKLTWTSSPGATSYEVFEGASAGGEGSTPVQTGSGSPLTVSGLTPGQQYFFTVEAVNAGGTSASSTELGATVVPAIPTGLAATAGNGSVSLTWSASAGAASYNVYQATTSGGEGVSAKQVGLTGTSATITGLSNGTRYYFTVAGVDAGGASAQSAEASATPAAPGGGGALDWISLGALAAVAAIARKGRTTNP